MLTPSRTVTNNNNQIEFKAMLIGIICSLGLAVYCVRTSWTRAGFVIAAWLGFFSVWLTSNIYPLILAWQTNRLTAAKIRAIEQATRLEDILELPESFEAFLKFCVREFTSENLVRSDPPSHSISFLGTLSLISLCTRHRCFGNV
jgi:hypothetical protein